MATAQESTKEEGALCGPVMMAEEAFICERSNKHGVEGCYRGGRGNAMNLSKVWLCGMALIMSAWVGCPAEEAKASAKDARPFWTEKSAFIEGDELFVVGVASRVKTSEDGRQQAFERGKIELMNYAQVTTLEAKGLAIETQMTFEESNSDGSVTVYRLLRVPVDKLLAIQERVQSQSKAQEQGMEKARQELLIVQKSLLEKERQAEALLKVLSNELRDKGLAPTPPTGSVINDLKQAETFLSKQNGEAALILGQARQRIRGEQQKNEARCASLEKGMTKEEVRALLGDPDEGSRGFKNPIEIKSATASKKMYDHPRADAQTTKQVEEDAGYQRLMDEAKESRKVYLASEYNTGEWFYGKAGRVTLHFDKIGEVWLIEGCKGK